MTRQDLGSIYTGIEYLRFIEGEKRLLYVSTDGLFLPRAEDDLSLAAVANDARVAIDTVQTGGLYADPPGLRSPPAQPGADKRCKECRGSH